MTRILSTIIPAGMLSVLLAAFTTGSALAGGYGYEGDGYYGGRSSTYSTCCYRRVVHYHRVHSEYYDYPRYRYRSYEDGPSYYGPAHYERPRYYRPRPYYYD